MEEAVVSDEGVGVLKYDEEKSKKDTFTLHRRLTSKCSLCMQANAAAEVSDWSMIYIEAAEQMWKCIQEVFTAYYYISENKTSFYIWKTHRIFWNQSSYFKILQRVTLF